MPVPKSGAGAGDLASPILQGEAASGHSTPALRDLSQRDKPWDKHRMNADTVELHYKGSEFNSYADRVRFCSEFLGFGLVPDEKGGAGDMRFKLRSARFCRVRHCPVCQWRRSLMWKAKAFQVLPRIVEAHPTHRWLFLTLTLKNCPITDLRDTLQQMNQAYRRMMQRKAWPAVGWLRSMEVTRGKDGSAHPHYHCLLLVPPSYFGKGYLKQAEWVELWRKSLRIDYNPILHVKPVKKGEQPMQLVPELLKYCVKESDLVQDRGWFLELTRQLHKMKAVGTGGVLKQYLKELENEPEDLIGEGEEAEEMSDEEFQLYFGWKRKEKLYRMVDH